MHELIVGGAGTGKTTELLRRYKGSQGALFLSQDGITPYKLALDIVASVEGKVPEPERTESTGEKRSVFASKKEYEARLMTGAPVSLCGEIMKSFGEIEIANFLFESKIDYIYEHPYKYDTRTAEYAQYRPDFYLPESDIYIEYFALDREGRAPAHFGGDGAYEQGVEWKSDLHKRMGTRLISLYAYEREEGRLVESLKKALKSFRVKLRHRRRGELYPKGASFIEGEKGIDFSRIIKRATEYARSGAYRCPYTHIFVDDIDLFEKDCIELVKALSVDITASARGSVSLADVRMTALSHRYRTPVCDFVFSHTKEGETEQILKRLDTYEKGAHVLVIGKSAADAALLGSRFTSLSYDREKGCVRVALSTRSDLKIDFCAAHAAEGAECDYAIVLSDAFTHGDEREFETALTRAKKQVCVISKTGEESPLAREYRESLGISKGKHGFVCPKCGGELAYKKGKYGGYLRCACGYKRNI